MNIENDYLSFNDQPSISRLMSSTKQTLLWMLRKKDGKREKHQCYVDLSLMCCEPISVLLHSICYLSERRESNYSIIIYMTDET